MKRHKYLYYNLGAAILFFIIAAVDIYNGSGPWDSLPMIGMGLAMIITGYSLEKSDRSS